MRSRPDIRSAEYEVAAQAVNLRIAEKEYLPRFSLNGSIGLHSTYLKDFLSRGSRVYSFGPSFDWRILDAGGIDSEIRQQKAVLQENVHVYRKTVLNAFREVEDSMIDYRYEKRREKHLLQALTAADKSVELSRALYTEGLRDYLAVLNALSGKQQAERDLLQNRENMAAAVVDLYKALGGGQ